MLTTLSEGTRVVDPNITILDSDPFKYQYLNSFFNEMGVIVEDEIEPLQATDSWLMGGELHGLSIHASFNTFESLNLCVGSKRIPYKGSLRDTLNGFIDLYREEWHEHHQNRGKSEGYM
jgi:hypothetical protein